MHKMTLLLASVFLVTGASAQLDFHSYGIELNSGNLTEVNEIQGNDLLLVNANLSLQNNSIENLSKPQNPQDAATKAYVDDNTGSSTDNQTLTIYNNTDGANDTINIEDGGNITLRDDYESAIPDDQALAVTNNSSGVDDQVNIDNGNSITLDDYYEADTTIPDDQNLSEVLAEGKVANVSINLTGNNLTGVANLSFKDAVRIGRDLGNTSQYGGPQNFTSNSPGDVIIGYGARATGYDTANYPYANGEVAIGLMANASGGNSIAIGHDVDAGKEGAIAIGGDAAKYATVLGTGADAEDHREVVLGYGAQGVEQSTVIGFVTEATAKEATVVGYNSDATGFQSIGLGTQTEADGKHSITIGYRAGKESGSTNNVPEGEGSVAIGKYAQSPNDYEATFGNLEGEELSVNVTGNTTIHGDLEVKGECTSCGSSSGSTENLSETVAAGNVANQTIEFSEGVSIGNGSTSTGSSSEIALGKGAFANDLSNNYNDSVAIGREANASDGDSVAIGPGSEATGLGTFALGTPAYATGGASISIGDDANSSGPVSIAIGNSPEASSKKSVAIGYFAGFESDEGNKSVTIGNYDLDTGTAPAGIGKESIALGTGARATKDGAVAIGDHAKAQNSYQATFGNLDGEELGVNITGNAAVHGDLDVKSGAVNNAEVLELDTSSLPTCDSSTEGEIRYNGTGHYGCDGSSWSAMY